MATTDNRTNAPVVGSHNAINDPNVAHTPAYILNNANAERSSAPNAGLSIFDNPVQGHVDTGVSHEGDLGGAG